MEHNTGSSKSSWKRLLAEKRGDLIYWIVAVPIIYVVVVFGLPLCGSLVKSAYAIVDKPPVSIEFRRSRTAPGMVAQITNTGNRKLYNVVVNVDPGTQSYAVKVLEPGKMVEAGWIELEYNLIKGQTVEVTCDEYSGVRDAVVP